MAGARSRPLPPLPTRGAISTRLRRRCFRSRRGWSRSVAAAASRVPFTGLWLDAPAETMRARIAGRRGDASDASVEILDRQLAHNPGALDWIGIAAGGDAGTTLAAARRAMMH